MSVKILLLDSIAAGHMDTFVTSWGLGVSSLGGAVVLIDVEGYCVWWGAVHLSASSSYAVDDAACTKPPY